MEEENLALIKRVQLRPRCTSCLVNITCLTAKYFIRRRRYCQYEIALTVKWNTHKIINPPNSGITLTGTIFLYTHKNHILNFLLKYQKIVKFVWITPKQ